MADIYLNVPFVSQLGFGDPSNPQNDWTGCWYAAACMVAYYFEAGPRIGLPEKFDTGKNYHSAMTNAEYPKLMANEHLVAIELPAGKAWSGEQLADLLRKFGPLSFGWNKTVTGGKTYGHRSVLIGYDDAQSEAVFHDPEKAPNSRLKLADLNAKFRWSNPYAMLRRDGPELVWPR